jgi:lipopolysaccharide cholinephosphotransferase
MTSLEEIQSLNISIFKALVFFLEKNNLRYYLARGSLLGAVRHKGFIPWDDDIDIVMPREDYNKLIALPNSAFDPPYKLHEITRMDDYYELYAKFVDTSVSISLIERQRRKGNDKYLWIDIYPLDGLPENKLRLFFIKNTSLFLRFLYKLSISDYGYQRTWLKNLIIMAINHFFSYKKIYNIFLKIISKYSFYYSKNAASITELDGSFYIYPVDIFDSPQRVLFSGVFYNAPKDTDKYLKITYGDYMKLPPESERTAKHKFILLDASFVL